MIGLNEGEGVGLAVDSSSVLIRGTALVVFSSVAVESTDGISGVVEIADKVGAVNCWTADTTRSKWIDIFSSFEWSIVVNSTLSFSLSDDEDVARGVVLSAHIVKKIRQGKEVIVTVEDLLS